VKYFAFSFLFLFNNQVLSLITLVILSLLFIFDILKARAEL